MAATVLLVKPDFTEFGKFIHCILQRLTKSLRYATARNAAQRRELLLAIDGSCRPTTLYGGLMPASDSEFSRACSIGNTRQNKAEVSIPRSPSLRYRIASPLPPRRAPTTADKSKRN